jgi:hypothetical protein
MEVKTKPANILALYDMGGNVWEWIFGTVFRGGSYHSNEDASHLRIGFVYPGDHRVGVFPNVGFRLARTGYNADEIVLPVVTGVTVSPNPASVTKGKTQSFTAIVVGENDPDQTVTWTVENNADVGTTINAAGLLTVAVGESVETIIVRATSGYDPNKSGTATVTIKPPVVFVKILEQEEGYETLEEAVSAASGKTATITVKSNLWVDSTITLGASNTHITLQGDGQDRYISYHDVLFSLEGSGNSLTLDAGVILNARLRVNSYNAALVFNDGAKITQYVYVTYGTFTMEGGVISGSNSGVYVDLNGTFVMNGGSITDGNGVSTMGTFVMNGGSIENNEADKGGGVYINTYGTFTMEGGSIKNNEANKGGGVYVYSGTFTLNDGSIENNEANEGGGVYVDHFAPTTFIMNGGSIKDNAAEYSGGGVYVYNNASFTMTNGSIEGNTVTGDSKGGGGVYLTSSAVITKTGGTIYGNNAYPDSQANSVTGKTDKGAAVYVDLFSSPVHLEKTVGISKDLTKGKNEYNPGDLTPGKGWTE